MYKTKLKPIPGSTEKAQQPDQSAFGPWLKLFRCISTDFFSTKILPSKTDVYCQTLSLAASEYYSLALPILKNDICNGNIKRSQTLTVLVATAIMQTKYTGSNLIYNI